VGVTTQPEDVHRRRVHFSKFPLTFGIGMKKGAAIEWLQGKDTPPGRQCSDNEAPEGRLCNFTSQTLPGDLAKCRLCIVGGLPPLSRVGGKLIKKIAS
jgi:hypothetical protein